MIDRYLHCEADTPPILRALAHLEKRTMRHVLGTAVAFYAVSSHSQDVLQAAGLDIDTLKLRAWEWEKRLP